MSYSKETDPNNYLSDLLNCTNLSTNSDDEFDPDFYLQTAKPFCDNGNIDNCIIFLSKELRAIGLSPLYKNGSVQCDNIKLINTIYNLLGKRSNERQVLEELQERVLRLSIDLDTKRSHLSRCQERLGSSEKNSQAHQEKYRQLALKNKSLQGELKTERDEVRRLQSVLQQRDAQFQHEQRRKERETTQLKERLHQTMSQKAPLQTSGITLINGLVRQDGRRGTWTTKASSTRNEDDLQRRIITGYDQRNRLLLEENVCLRELISTLTKEFQTELQPDENPLEDKDASCGIQNIPLLQLPLGGKNGAKLEKAILDLWQRTRALLQNSPLNPAQEDTNHHLQKVESNSAIHKQSDKTNDQEPLRKLFLDSRQESIPADGQEELFNENAAFKHEETFMSDDSLDISQLPDTESEVWPNPSSTFPSTMVEQHPKVATSSLSDDLIRDLFKPPLTGWNKDQKKCIEFLHTPFTIPEP